MEGHQIEEKENVNNNYNMISYVEHLKTTSINKTTIPKLYENLKKV